MNDQPRPYDRYNTLNGRISDIKLIDLDGRGGGPPTAYVTVVLETPDYGLLAQLLDHHEGAKRCYLAWKPEVADDAA